MLYVTIHVVLPLSWFPKRLVQVCSFVSLVPGIIKDCKEVEWYIILQRVLIEDVREYYLRGVPQSAHTPVDLDRTLGELLTLNNTVAAITTVAAARTTTQ